MALRAAVRRAGRVGVLLAGLSAALGAQGGVRGVVFDSLLTGRPVDDGLVTVDGTAARARTDARGRFEIDGLPAGNYIVRYHALWLDSLSLPPLVARAQVRTARIVRVDLASPSVGAYQRAVCGTTFSVEEGIVRGEVRDAEGAVRPGIFVGAVWTEAVLTPQGLGGRLRGSIDTTNVFGIFSLCGVPREADFHIRAGSDTLGTGELLVSLAGRPVTRRDIVIGTRDLTARVAGRVTTADGTPITSVVITVSGDSLLSARADEEGRFAIAGLPRRSAQLFVRSVGFVPRMVPLDPGSGEVEVPDIVLDPVPQELDAVRVEAARSLAELEFLERRRTGTGIFLDEDELLRFPMLSANVLSTVAPGVRSSGGRSPRIVLRRGIQPCNPRFFVDGVDFGIPVDGMEEADLLRRAKRVEIHSAAFMPARYTDFNGCGVVLIWTQ